MYENISRNILNYIEEAYANYLLNANDSRFNEGIVRAETHYGDAYYAEHDGIVFLPRHLPGHKTPPHRINYRANVDLLRTLGVDGVISIYAVGSITRKLVPSAFGLVKDFIDFAFGRENTFYDGTEDIVRHVPMIDAFDRELSAAFVASAALDGYPIPANAVYVTTNGPRFETSAEIEAFRRIGGDVVGMTLGTEVALLREAGIRNASVAYSINWAAGLDAEGMAFMEGESIMKMVSTVIALAEKTLRKF